MIQSLLATATHSTSQSLHFYVARSLNAFRLSNRYGLILLCEAAVKPTFEQLSANYNAGEDCKSAGKMCELYSERYTINSQPNLDE